MEVCKLLHTGFPMKDVIREVDEPVFIEIMMTNCPKGKFWMKGVTGYLAIKNLISKPIVVMFKTKEDMTEWLEKGNEV